MRRGFLGSIAALVAGAGAVWGQAPMPVRPANEPVAIAPASIGPSGDVIQAQAAGGPAPVLMPPLAVGPPDDPLGLGPTAGLGPPPGPMYPMPGPPGAPMYQPPPTGAGFGGAPHWWFRGEYVMMFPTAQPVGFSLLTTGSPNQGGVGGQPTTLDLIGPKSIDYGALNGFRLNGGFFGDPDRRFGFDFSSLYLQPGVYKKEFAADTEGNVGLPVLARPFIDTTGALKSLVIVSPTLPAQPLPGTTPVPGVPLTTNAFGDARVYSSTSLWTAEPSAIWNLFRSAPGCKCLVSLDYLLGYKYLQLNEDIEIHSRTILRGFTTNTTFAPGPFGVPVVVGTTIVPTPVGVGGVLVSTPSTINIADKFVTTNQFNGANFGLRGEVRYGMFSLAGTGKLAIGNMHQTLRIRGVTDFEDPANAAQGWVYTGLLANATNIGTYTKDVFTAIPELSLMAGINLTNSVRMYFGYNVIYISNVLRPGNQLNPVVDSSTIPYSPNYGTVGNPPGMRKPLFQDDFWVHGVSFGLSVTY